MAQNTDQTLVLIKPDAIKNSLTGYMLSLLSEFQTGLRITALKVVNVPQTLAQEHYAEHRGKGFFPSLLEYIMGKSHFPDQPQARRVIAVVFQGADAVKKLRDLAGPTDPHKARDQKPGCIRALGALIPVKNEKGETVDTRMDNLIHASATDPEAEREVKMWFFPSDIPAAMRAYPVARCESAYYYRDGKLSLASEAGGICVGAPGDLMWESDLNALQLIAQGKAAPVTLEAVIAKNLINRE